MGDRTHDVVVFAPVISVTVTVESGSENGAEVHFHPGGQGFWVARMLRHLGQRPLLCGPMGGESGGVAQDLLEQWQIDLSPVQMSGDSPVVIQDRRSGHRSMFAETSPPHLSRHELDDLYGTFLENALSVSTCVISGQLGDVIPGDFYRRLGHDLGSAEVTVIADVHGSDLDSFLTGGMIDVLKVSHDDLGRDGAVSGEAEDKEEILGVIDSLMAQGAGAVVVSLAEGGALADYAGTRYRVRPPEFDPADHRGAGDSMTAGLAAASVRGLPAQDALRLACAAGAANVTRHGLGSAAESLIPGLAERVQVEELVGETQ
jgi:1-phosphofructokinase